MARPLGAVACGHQATAESAAEILRDGGNAYDAAVAAHLTACVAEPVLASLAGGGYALVHPQGATPRIFDFFTQTPQRQAAPHRDDFHPVDADFGQRTQEFHVGVGAAAVPGAVLGIFAMHQELCSLPLGRLAEPALRAARAGITIRPFHAYLFQVVAPIFTLTAPVRSVFAIDGRLPEAGRQLIQQDLGNTIEALVAEGSDLFYRGEIGKRLITLCDEGGGTLTSADLDDYRVNQASPLTVRYRNTVLHTNPPPSSGGTLIGFGLGLLDQVSVPEKFGSSEHVELLAAVMALTQRSRLERADAGLDDLLNPALLERYRTELEDLPACLRGTTHISIVDGSGNLAALTLSNGEGCGHLIPGTGIMLNNMLGEADINPQGFQRWSAGTRMTSMMAPSLLEFDADRRVVMGSGGSNRIRTALMQVVSNLVDFGMSIEDAVASPRAHLDGSTFSLEPDLDDLRDPGHLEVERWQEPNLFFGGVHCIEQRRDTFEAVGDPRRDGVGLVVD
jgi:gamma-glutamyltranspeptidase/glutathione hydrolase